MPKDGALYCELNWILTCTTKFDSLYLKKIKAIFKKIFGIFLDFFKDFFKTIHPNIGRDAKSFHVNYISKIC